MGGVGQARVFLSSAKDFNRNRSQPPQGPSFRIYAGGFLIEQGSQA